MKIVLLFAIGLMFPIRPTAAQGATPELEVATIKPTDPSGMHFPGVKIYPGGRVVVSTISLKGLVAIAFHLSYWQISGGDAWIEKDNYEVEGKPPENLRSSIVNLRYSWYGIEDQLLREMLQAVLIDRFQLKFHRETKTGKVYLLERNGKTLSLRPTQAPSEAGHSGDIGFAGGRWVIFNTAAPQLAKFAADNILLAPVLDRTELTGSFDYRQPTPLSDSEAIATDRSDAFLRLIGELGLKLERTQGPTETFVIDRAEKPTPN